MYRWVISEDEKRQQPDGPEALVRFAASQDGKPVRLPVMLESSESGPIATVPTLATRSAYAGHRRDPPVQVSETTIRYGIEVDPPANPEQDDEVVIDLEEISGMGVPRCRLVLRRTRCKIADGLLKHSGGQEARSAETIAALRWLGWNRFVTIAGLKRFKTGRGGSDVFVVRPQLRLPDASGAWLESSGPPQVLEGSWGSCLLIKTGPAEKIRKEWKRCNVFLSDRLQPFLARCEAFLAIRSPAGEDPASEPPRRATLISSFLGGDLLHPEPLEEIIRAAADPTRGRRLMDKVFTVLAPWQTPSAIHPLAEWRRVFRAKPSDRARAGNPLAEKSPLAPRGNVPSRSEGRQLFSADEWLLFGKFDLTKKNEQSRSKMRKRAAGGAKADEKDPGKGREEFAEGLRWDSSFISEEHLDKHLMRGKTGDEKDKRKKSDKDDEKENEVGLLDELRAIKAKFSLTHGDLNPRNILCEGDDTWLIDFEQTGVAPTLLDHARLEANLRLWCLPLVPAGDGVEDAAREFESRLLDHFLGSEGGIEPTRELARSLGAQPDKLHQVAHQITHIRRLAAAHCLPEYPDRRDYLAVLYLTVLSLLQYAGRRMAPPENYRVLVAVAWVLEETLDRILGRKPYDRKRTTLKPRHLLFPDWVLPPGAPERALYFLDRDDGRQALPWLAACRGVLQFPPHHLDVLDHVLLVLANVEHLLGADDPLAPLLNPAAADQRVADELDRQGVHVLPIPPPEAGPSAPDTTGLDVFLDVIRERLRLLLAEPPSQEAASDEAASSDAASDEARLRAVRHSRLLLKWCALLHDVGKPGSRSVNTERRPAKVQFIGHEYYGSDLVDGFLQDLFREPVPEADPTQGGQSRPAKAAKSKPQAHGPAATAGVPAPALALPPTAQALGLTLLKRLRRMMPSHHLHHQIVQRYKEHPGSLRALIEGLKARDVPDAEYDYLSSFLEPSLVDGRIAGDYQPDFPLLIVFGFADRLSCRGPNNVTSITQTARIDLAVLAFWACYAEIRAQYVKRKRKKEQPSRVFQRLSGRLRAASGKDENEWKGIGQKVLGRLRHGYDAERKARIAGGNRGPLVHELIAQGKRILEEVNAPPATGPKEVPDPAAAAKKPQEEVVRSPANGSNGHPSGCAWEAWTLTDMDGSPLGLHPGALRVRGEQA
jgi:hypothetical protein